MPRLDDELKKLEELLEKKAPLPSEFEHKVRILIEETGCTEEQAKSMLELCGDVDEAMNVIKSLGKKNIFIIKGRFKAPNIKCYGLFFAVSNVEKETLLRLVAVCAQDVTLVQFDETASWEVFEKVIYGLRLKEGVSALHTHNVERHLRGIFRKKKDELFSLIKKWDPDALSDFLRQELSFALQDKEVHLRIATDQIASFGEEEKHTQKKEPQKHITLSTSLAISPVSGVSVKELKEGQMVVLRIVDERPFGRYIATLLGARDGERTIPIVAPVKEVQEIEPVFVKVTTSLAPGILGEAIESEDVKALLAPPSLQGVEEEKEEKIIETSPFLIPLIIILLLLILVLLL